jgi:uncharacterized membrane protein
MKTRLKGPIVKIRITRAGIKTVARFVVARSVSTTISMLVHQNASPDTKLEIASVHIGAFVIGEMVGEAAKPYVDRQIDEIGDGIEKIKAQHKELADS